MSSDKTMTATPIWRKLPLLQHLQGYTLDKFGKDARAGVNVALFGFPQAIAFSMVAGLPVIYGIFGSAIGSLFGPLFASSRHIMLGPSNASAVLLLSGFLALNLPDEQKLAAMPLLMLMVAALMFLGALLRVERMIQYVSRGVIAGYITAAAFLIMVNQLRDILAVDSPRAGTFGEALLNTIKYIPQTHFTTLGIALFTAGIFLLLNKFLKSLPNIAITLIVSGGLVYFLNSRGANIPTLSAIEAGHLPISLPDLGFSNISKLSSIAFSITFLTLLESSSIAKSLAARSGDQVNIRQQMVSMGITDTIAAFCSGMPASGSLTRSMLNFSSGAVTPISSIIAGSIVLTGALLAGPLIGYIPRPALAALVFIIGIKLIDPPSIRVFIKASKSDAATFLATFIAGLLFPLDMAIYIGVGTSLFLFLKKVSEPKLVEIDFNQHGELVERDAPTNPEKSAVSIVHVEGDLFFGSTDVFLDQMRTLVSATNIRVVILRLLNAYHVDASVTLAIGELVSFARDQGRDVLICGVRPEIDSVIHKSGIIDVIGEENFFRYTPDNVTLSTRDALKRAQEIMGNKSPDIILFAKKKEENEEEE